MPTPDEKQIQFAAELRKLADEIESGAIAIMTIGASMTNEAEVLGLAQTDGMANRIHKVEMNFYHPAAVP